MITLQIVSFINRLQSPDRRAAAAHELAHCVGAKHVVIFGKDAEIGVFLPALGLPQTLRQGAKWQQFLTDCAQAGEASGFLPYSDEAEDFAVKGVADDERRCIMVFLGGAPDLQMLDAIKPLLPLLGAKLADERIVTVASGHAQAAREATKKSGALNEALEKNRHELRKAVAAAEHELAYRRVAENKLLEADHRKNEFLAMLAHELRNPLSAISNAVELVERLETTPSSTIGKANKAIRRQTEHLIRLVNDLLDVARITQGKVTLKSESVLVADFIAAALEMVQPILDSRNHRLTLTMPEPTLRITGDAARLSQVVANLLDNAAKYTPKGGSISLVVRPDLHTLIVTVEDNGIGIPPAAIDDVFTMFLQAGRTQDRAADGLGIGLCLVKMFVEMHKGSVTVASAGVGHGSLFCVTIPMLPDEASNADDAFYPVLSDNKVSATDIL